MKRVFIKGITLAIVAGSCIGGHVEAGYDGERPEDARRPEVNFIDDKVDIVDTAYNASVGVNGPAAYYNFNYSNIKIDNAKLHGNDMVLGTALTKGNIENKDTITQGPFFEYGDSKYNSNDYFYANESGKIKKYGVGYLFRQVKAGRYHIDGYIRTGKVSNDFRLVDGHTDASYDNGSRFYAAHVGYGQYVPLDQHTTIDVYGKYFYQNIAGSDTTLHSGGYDEKIEFDALNTHKFRIGSKITWDYMEEKKKKMYADVALEHELSYDQNVQIWGRKRKISSGADTTGVLEIGYRQVFGPCDAFLFTADLQGYTGTRKGIGGNVAVRFNF